ncbi:hypothetical protein FA13DRAFT_580760 [Coprinellus micaceus]|uniref:Uncharacterized protein n=1 Tax=Coprinellus micaceus TaxID=71717 RepID=A0A4Y7T7W3_COPMI|nr:hypothetical protein FA13DRAFT_580760 [Coprinellus micaceus]
MSLLTLNRMLSEEAKLSAEEEEALLAALTAFLGSIVPSRFLRRSRRVYYGFRRRDLLPSARHGTPWQRLWEGQSDRAFITTMGFNVSTFQYLLDAFKPRWDDWTIPRGDVSRVGAPRTGARSLASGNSRITFGLFALSPLSGSGNGQKVKGSTLFVLNSPTAVSRSPNAFRSAGRQIGTFLMYGPHPPPRVGATRPGDTDRGDPDLVNIIKSEKWEFAPGSGDLS